MGKIENHQKMITVFGLMNDWVSNSVDGEPFYDIYYIVWVGWFNKFDLTLTYPQ